MAYEFKRERQIEFAETDMAGIAHFANFFRFMEESEHAFFRSLGHTVHSNAGGAMSGWVRVNASCDYLGPLHYLDVVEIQVLIEKIGGSSIGYAFVFRKQPAGRVVARGRMTVVHVARPKGADAIQKVPIPDTIRATLEVAPKELLEPTAE